MEYLVICFSHQAKESKKVYKKCAYPESETANLPRIEDLHISVPEAECVEMGEVHAVVDDQACRIQNRNCNLYF